MSKTLSRIWERFYSFVFYYLIPDSWEIRYRFHKSLGYHCHLRHPESFNEKIQWIKLHDRNPLYPYLSDKIKVKEFISQHAGQLPGLKVIPMIGSKEGYRHFADIPFDILPDRFVIKCNHDSSSTIVCKDKSNFDYGGAEKKIEAALRRNFYHYVGKQWGYKDISPRVFVEEYMENGVDEALNDYKFMMFNGECKCVLVCAGRFDSAGLKKIFYDTDWNPLPFTRGESDHVAVIPKPKHYDEMLDLANRLAGLINNRFVRVDLYEINDSVYFGEFTFYPGGGSIPFEPREWDYIMGKWLKL